MVNSLFLFLFVLSFLLISTFSISSNCGDCNSDCNYTTCEICTNCQFSWDTSKQLCITSLNLLEIFNNNEVEEAYDCPIPLPNQNNPNTGYSHNFTRTKLAPVVAATYAESDDEIMGCLKNYYSNDLELYKRYNVSCPGINDNCFGYIAISESEELILLAFRGSSITQYLLENIDFLTFDKVPFPLGGHLLNYWSDAFFNIWNGGLEDDLKVLLPQYQNKQFKLWITGHSLGGVLAAVSTMYIIKNELYPTNLVEYISFGEPRIGDQVFAQIFDDIVPYKYRVINRYDPITHQPYRLQFQTGNDSFWHHHYEVWYSKDMCPNSTFIICPRAEDPSCSNSAGADIDPTARDHAYYFGVSITTWYQSGCNQSEVCTGDSYLDYIGVLLHNELFTYKK